MYCNTANCVKTIDCGVAINFLKIPLVLQLARSDVQIGWLVYIKTSLKLHELLILSHIGKYSQTIAVIIFCDF